MDNAMIKSINNNEGKDKNSNPIDEYICNLEMSQDIQSRNILHWNYRNLSEIPREILLSGEHIQEIYLKRNCLTKLPSEIGRLKNLTNLYLIGNKLESLPEEIGQLRSLKVLDLSQNFLQKLPGSLGDLYELQDLLVTQNQISTLPSELRRLSKLKFLELSGNKISHLCTEIINGLVSLEDLAIDQNPIRYLPRNISHLKSLRYLSVCRGELEFIHALPIYQFAQVNRQKIFQTGDLYMSEFPQFRFDGNPKLQHLPIWMPQFYGMNLDTFGCGIDDSNSCSSLSVQANSGGGNFPIRKSVPHNAIQLYFERLIILYFDDDIQKIYRPHVKKPCSLLELCLRQFENQRTQCGAQITISSNSVRHLKYFVPTNLYHLLNGGPTAKCFQCEQRMFTQVWALIFSLPTVGNNGNKKLRLTSILFCDSNCAGYFLTNSGSGVDSRIADIYQSILQNEVVW